MISKINEFEIENKRLILLPLQIIASILVIAGSFALMFEVSYFAEFSLDIYFGRVIATIIGFVVLLLTNFSFGQRNLTALIHVSLITIIGSFGSIIIRIPDSLYFNSHLLALVIFTSALFLSWDLKNQIILAIYYNLIFAASILLTDSSIYFLPNMFASVIYVIAISLLSIAATSINFSMRRKAILKSLEAKEFFENSNEALFKLNLDNTKFVTVNKSFISLFGFTEKQVKSLSFAELFSNENDYKKVMATIDEIDTLNNYNIMLINAAGENFQAAINARIYKDLSNDKTLEGSIRDITKEKTAEDKIKKYNEELQALNTSKDKFFSIVAHDLVSPFSAVIGYSEILLDEYNSLPREQIGEFAKSINSVSNNANRLLTELIDWSRIQTGRMFYQPQSVNLNNIAADIMMLFTEVAKKKEITISNLIDKNYNVFADYKMLGTSFRNLVSNALKFTSHGGEILLKAEDKNKHYEITVQDNGVGMSSEVQGKLFQIDVHHTQRGTDNEKGTGLGLILTQEFIKKHGGSIWVESELGKGARFIFTLPKETEVSTA